MNQPNGSRPPGLDGIDYYEVLQVSSHADSETIERVYRHLAKRLHPDNPETGNAERFKLLSEAFRTLADPESRAAYDAKHEAIREKQWQVLDQASATDDVEADRRIRLGILTILYATRRNDVDRPGLGIYELERLMGSPEHQMKFHIWYLKENGWIQRLENGQFAITAAGVDRVAETDVPWRKGPLMLRQGSENVADDPPQEDPGSGPENAQDEHDVAEAV